jgi:cytosine/adenosine deaminase-related metal-dependent hydrolase
MTLRNDRLAILKGMRAALRLHRDMATSDRLDRSFRVDVFDAITRSGAMLMFQPLDKLLGAYRYCQTKPCLAGAPTFA